MPNPSVVMVAVKALGEDLDLVDYNRWLNEVMSELMLEQDRIIAELPEEIK